MAMKPGVPIAIGAALLLLALSGDASAKPRPGAGGRDPIGPIPVPESDSDLRKVGQTVCDCWEALGRPQDAARVQACAAESLYPNVAWPPVQGDDPSVAQAWAVIGQVTQDFLASADKEAWCAAVNFDGAAILEEWVASEPTDGAFYKIQANQTFSGIVREALNRAVPGAGNDSGLRLEYMKCITSGPRWNYRLYASPSFSSNFPDYYGVNGRGLRRAFYPWHEDASTQIAQARMPQRAITQAGERIPGMGSSYAMLWLPPLDRNLLAQGVVTCGYLDWDDGSSSIDPPSELLDILEAN